MLLLPVLTYHAVGPPLDPSFAPFTVSKAQLSEQMAALREAGYRLMSLTAALQAYDALALAPRDAIDGTRYVALTFDDGYTDFAEAALPVLQEHKASATLFVVTDLVGRRATWLPFAKEQERPLLSWSDLEELAQHDIEIGSHGCRHLELDVIPLETARDEIERSRSEIGAHLPSPTCFAYPFGYHSARVRHLVASAGYSAACEVGRGLYPPAADRLRIRRLLIQPDCTPDALVRRLTGPIQLPADRIRELARPIWREVRRGKRSARGLLGRRRP